jgi:hypothetical protein
MLARSTVRVAVQIAPERADYAAIRRAASRAETLGVDAIFNWDHFYRVWCVHRSDDRRQA